MDIRDLLKIASFVHKMDPAPIPARLHIADGQHTPLAQEVLELIERRIREQNPDISHEVCEECVVNTAFTLNVLALKTGVERGRSDGWVRYTLHSILHKAETLATIVAPAPARKIALVMSVLDTESTTGEGVDMERVLAG